MTPPDTQRSRLESRIERLCSDDSQFAAAWPSPNVSEAAGRPGLRLPQIVRTVMEGYADRPALGQRASRLVTDPATGPTSTELLPGFDTITYQQTWDRIVAVATALQDEVRPGDRVALLGFGSIDYATLDMAVIHLGAVSLPLQATARHDRLRPIVAETRPAVIAASLDSLADAVELALTGHAPARLVVFDYRPEVDDQREVFDAARARLAHSSVALEAMTEVIERGRRLPPVPERVSADPDPLSLVIYTSGSTGEPKGAMYTERLVANTWRRAMRSGTSTGALPVITLGFMPMSHVMGRMLLYSALGNGGTCYFAATSDLSTLLEDLARVRPTRLDFVPRVWEMLFKEYQSRLARGHADAAGVLADMRQNVIGGRYTGALSGSAPISDELRAWVEELLDMPLTDGYGSTETGLVVRDGKVARPPVIDYKLVDVPELGYFSTDRPHPRGELAVRTATVFAGYYNRPELTASVFDADGYYLTGDIMAETAPDRLVYVDRRNNVLKLSQGEFVTVSALESVYAESPLVRQIYVYGNSACSYLLAVVVPTEEVASREAASKPAILSSLRDIAKAAGLQSYEIVRDLIIETTPFSPENGLLTESRKPARPKLVQRYGPRLERLYQDLAAAEADELEALRRDGADLPVLETITRAVGILLGATDVRPDAHFTDLGGDSLSALTFASLLRDIFGVEFEVTAGVIVSPANDLRRLAGHIEALRSGPRRPALAAVHGTYPDEIRARDLTLDKFLDADLLHAAPGLPRADTGVRRTLLLTGATGFLGRYLALEWLERLSPVGGRLICLVRAQDDAAARQRLDHTFDRDPHLLEHYRSLAGDHLEVLAADKAEPDLGLNSHTWSRLAETVDLIVDPAALVNHVLGYDQLFGPNVVGTAELIRLALTTRIKPFIFVSTLGVGDGVPGLTEDVDIREASPVRRFRGSYASGYTDSKWAGEVLLREAHDLCGLPVSVFRCDMIMTDTRYAGQPNLPDLFTRLMFSLAATGIAPGSFYELDADGQRPRSHWDGLPVDFIAEAVTTIGVTAGFRTFHVANPHDDGISLDTFVDWLIDAGYQIERIPGYDEWLRRFEGAIRALPERQRQHSLLPLLHNYQRPARPVRHGMATVERFRAAVQEAQIPPDNDIPHLTPAIIVKYLTNLQSLGLL